MIEVSFNFLGARKDPFFSSSHPKLFEKLSILENRITREVLRKLE